MGVWLSRPQPPSHSCHTCVNQGDKAFSQPPKGKLLPSCGVRGLVKAVQPFILPQELVTSVTVLVGWTGMFTGRVVLKKKKKFSLDFSHNSCME